MRQSFIGESASVSTPLAKLREPARTRMARRPPNSGIVMASSTSRDGSADSSSPSSRTSEKGSLGSSTADAISASARSRTRPASGTVKQDDGAAGIGPGEKSVDVFSAERDHDGPFLTSFRDTRLRVDPESENCCRIPGSRFAPPE